MRVPIRNGWRARCAATDDLLLAAMLAVLVLVFVAGFFLFVGGFFLFVGELTGLLAYPPFVPSENT